LLRVAVLAYPAQFRAQFGADLGAALAERWHDAAAAPPGVAWGRRAALVIHTTASGLAERGGAVRRLTWRTHRPHLYAFTGRRATMWDSLRSDLTAAVRGLTKARGFTAPTVLALALGLGANSAVFAVINGCCSSPFPTRRPSAWRCCGAKIRARQERPIRSRPPTSTTCGA